MLYVLEHQTRELSCRETSWRVLVLDPAHTRRVPAGVCLVVEVVRGLWQVERVDHAPLEEDVVTSAWLVPTALVSRPDHRRLTARGTPRVEVEAFLLASVAARTPSPAFPDLDGPDLTAVSPEMLPPAVRALLDARAAELARHAGWTLGDALAAAEEHTAIAHHDGPVVRDWTWRLAFPTGGGGVLVVEVGATATDASAHDGPNHVDSGAAWFALPGDAALVRRHCPGVPLRMPDHACPRPSSP